VKRFALHHIFGKTEIVVRRRNKTNNNNYNNNNNNDYTEGAPADTSPPSEQYQAPYSEFAAQEQHSEYHQQQYQLPEVAALGESEYEYYQQQQEQQQQQQQSQQYQYDNQ
jgi:hypothetical protein